MAPAHALTHLGALVRMIGTLGLGRHQDGGELGLVDMIAARERRRRLDGVDADDGLTETLFVGADACARSASDGSWPSDAQLFARGLEFAAHAANATRPGVLAERVDHGAADAALGKGLELDAAALVEPLCRIDEANDAVLNQVAQVDGVRHGRGHTARQRLHKRKTGLDPPGIPVSASARAELWGGRLSGGLLDAHDCDLHPSPRNGAPALTRGSGSVAPTRTVGLGPPIGNPNASLVQRRGGACTHVDELR